MRRKSALLSFFALVITWGVSNAAFSFHVKEDLPHLCRQRLNILKFDLAKVVKKSSYERKYRKEVMSSIESNEMTSEQYKKRIKSIEEIVQKDEEMAITNCLMASTDLLLTLDAIAEVGHKNLNDFSKTWKNAFPHQVKKLGY